ncbi:MAG TPA: aminotransferase class V-fold PLP-dependent enzyme [Baekduia sp.]|nr:aminotransferase class V-fold PLP-dependent enzyme [Baekduia sp.]
MSLQAPADVRSAFPVLAGNDIAYLDSAATSQTPSVVIDAIVDYYETARASVHRGVYPLAADSTARFEGARQRIAAFLNWPAQDTVFTRNATEALNLVAHGLRLGPDDVVVLSEMEHHSNLVPWQMTGAQLRWLSVDGEGRIDLAQLEDYLEAGDVSVVTLTHVSNVLGTINPVAEAAALARKYEAVSVVDGSQAIPQLPVDVGAVDADFYAWTGHKAYGPTGVGVLHGRHQALVELEPLLGGGHMIARVTRERSKWGEVPMKFEAGTSPIAEAIGLGAAVDWIGTVGIDNIRAHELEITAYALERLGAVEGLTLHGPPSAEDRGAVVSFAVDFAHPHDVSEILGTRGVCVRAGHHCAQVLMDVLGVPATTRASFAVHSSLDEVDRLVEGIEAVRKVFA